MQTLLGLYFSINFVYGIIQRHFRLERVYKINKEASVTGVDKNLVNQFVPEASINNIISSEQNYVNKSKNNENIEM